MSHQLNAAVCHFYIKRDGAAGPQQIFPGSRLETENPVRHKPAHHRRATRLMPEMLWGGRFLETQSVPLGSLLCCKTKRSGNISLKRDVAAEAGEVPR